MGQQSFLFSRVSSEVLAITLIENVLKIRNSKKKPKILNFKIRLIDKCTLNSYCGSKLLLEWKSPSVHWRSLLRTQCSIFMSLHYLKRNHFICHDVTKLPVCARLSECETVVCLRLNYILSKNHDSYLYFLEMKIPLPNQASNLYNFHSPSSFDTQIGEQACSKRNYPVFTARFSRHSVRRIA